MINVGFAKANNQGFEKARGEFVLFLNNDTIFIEDSINKIMEIVPLLIEDFIVSCRLLNPDKTTQPSIVDFDNTFNMLGENFYLNRFFP